MSKADFGYQYTFPPSIQEEFELNPEIDRLSIARNKKIPIVFLFGWLGSKDKHLAKYGSIYEDLGYITIRFVASRPSMVVRLDKLPNLANKFLNFIDNRSLNDHPIFLHVFSNSGTYFYQQLSSEMQKQKKQISIKGVVFDSALCKRRFTTVYHFTKALIGGHGWYTVPLSLLSALLVMTYFHIWGFLKAAVEFKKPEAVNITLADEPFSWPQLLIYSKTDQLNPWKDVEEFAQRREEKGVKIRKLCFENSPHVQHLMTHREIYIKTVVDFVQACL